MSRRRAAKPREPVEVFITDLSHEGRGVGRVDGKTIFVHGALPDETVLAKVLKRRGRFDEAEVVNVLKPSPRRVAPRCPHFGTCGGCSLQHMSEADQLAHKQAVLLELLEHQAKVVPDSVAPPVRSPQWGYRRKARLGVKYVEKKGGVIVGFRERAKPYVTDCHQCDVLDPRVGELIEPLRACIQGLSISHRIPQIEIAATEDVVALVFRHLEPLSPNDQGKLSDFASKHGVDIYLQSGGLDTVVALDDVRTLKYRIDEVSMQFRPFDFTQVNHEVNQQMVSRALNYLAPQPTDRVADLFCGIGNFSLPLARRVADVTGIEGDTGLIERAHANAQANGLHNARFLVADLSDTAVVAELPLAKVNKMLLDPPRAGAAVLLETASFAGVESFVYVSCNPVTLARDCATICERHGFALIEVGILDMFPHTAHVESMAFFQRR